MNSTDTTARSTFVSVIAWLFIVMGGFATLIAIVQNVMILAVMPQIAQNMPADDPNLPPLMRFVLQNIRWLFLGILALSATTFVAALGLLMRQNWARLLFIGMMTFGILWNLVGIVMQQMFLSSMMPPLPSAPDGVGGSFHILSNVVLVASALFALSFCALFGWIIKRLLAPEVRAEFA